MNSNFFKILATHTRSHLTLPLAHALIRKSSEIQFLASYPRSGSTWVRTMVCNVLVQNANSDPQVFNREIPGVSLKNLALVNQPRPTRYAFTHAGYQPSIKKCVYIVRDGRDAIVSYYHYTTTRQGLELPFQQWFEYYAIGYYGPRWDQNILSWLTHGQQELGVDLKIVRFENIKKDTKYELDGILTFLDIPISSQTIESAIQTAGIEQGKQWEKHYRGNVKNANASLYRGGKVGDWQDYLNGNTLERFMHLSAKAFEVAGYSQ